MKTNIYTIRDIKLEYIQPTTAANDYVILREIKEAVNTPNHQMSKYSEDLELWKIGVFDTETGEIVDTEKKFIIKLNELKEQIN